MLSNLEEVRLNGLPKLGHICNSIPPQVLCFQNLKLLEVKKCGSVTYLFPPSMVSALAQLQDLNIEDCQKMEGIFSEEGMGFDNGPLVLCFQNIKFLRVKQCHCWMYLFPYTVSLGQLQELRIEHCPKMKKIMKEDRPPQGSSLQNLKLVWVKQCDSMMYLFSASMALDLRQLKDLCLEDCPTMKEIITTEYRDFESQSRLVSSFQNLKSVGVKRCSKLMYLFPSSMALGFVQLQELSIEHCFDMEVIFKEDRDTRNRTQQVLCFQNLKLVQVKQCNNLMYLFSSSFAAALVQLQDLCIEHCSMMKEIVMSEKGVADEIIFPQLTRVSLLKLPKLTSFYPSQNLEKIHSVPMVLFNEKVAFPKMELLHASGLNNVKKLWQNELLPDSFNKLKEMKVENCNELQNISTSNVLINWLPSLGSLRITSCGKLQEVFDLKVDNVGEHVTDSQLTDLVLENVHNLKHICHKVPGRNLCIQNLENLQVHECNSMKNLFSLYTEPKAEGEIIREEEVIDKIEFPQLASLALKCMPSLENFYPGNHTLRMVGLQDHDILITVLFNEKVSFPSLKSLDISGLDSIKKVWHNKLIENSFGKHKQVEIEDCNERQNGSSSNVLKEWLQSLHFLRIASCGQLKEVFDLEGVGHIQEDVIATELKHLVLQDLPRLEYIWNKDPYGILTFQKLDLVEVIGCHGLKSHFPVGRSVRDLPQLEKQLIRSRGPPISCEEEDEGNGFEFPEVIHDQPPCLRKIKGKEVMNES